MRGGKINWGRLRLLHRLLLLTVLALLWGTVALRASSVIVYSLAGNLNWHPAQSAVGVESLSADGFGDGAYDGAREVDEAAADKAELERVAEEQLVELRRLAATMDTRRLGVSQRRALHAQLRALLERLSPTPSDSLVKPVTPPPKRTRRAKRQAADATRRDERREPRRDARADGHPDEHADAYTDVHAHADAHTDVPADAHARADARNDVQQGAREDARESALDDAHGEFADDRRSVTAYDASDVRATVFSTGSDGTVDSTDETNVERTDAATDIAARAGTHGATIERDGALQGTQRAAVDAAYDAAYDATHDAVFDAPEDMGLYS
mmetsp:Transcript_53956/g.117692  ORF Transcript_53956/g.117692 Transcript_53956/m.117692 type:complete len:327 (-) Transcript_53956:274-1254(-)